MLSLLATVVLAVFGLAEAQTFDHTTAGGVSQSVVIGNGVSLSDFCFQLGVTHTSIMDLKIDLTFTNIQGFGINLSILNQPSGQLDDVSAASPITFTNYNFHTPASQMGVADGDPVTGFFYAPALQSVIGRDNRGTWKITVQDLVNNADSGTLVSFNPFFNDPLQCGQSSEPSSMPSSSPVMSPTPQPVNTTCFAGTNLVSVLGKGEIQMDALQIGDHVRTENGFSKVYGFLHLQRNLEALFLQIICTSQDKVSQIEVSPNHMLFSIEKSVAAHAVQLGDRLKGEGGEVLTVLQINTVMRKGVYAPATESGDILVGGILASNYVHLFSGSAINQHNLLHALVVPRRQACRLIDCQEETYTSDGYARWIEHFIVITAVLNKQTAMIQYAATLVFVPVAALLSLFDIMAGQGLLGIALFVVIAFRVRRGMKAKML